MEKIKAGKQTVDLLKLCYRSGRSPMLWGLHGIGKSELLEQASHELGIDFISRDLSLMEPPDLIGLPKADGKTTKFLPPDFLPQSGQGFLVFEELNRCERYMRAPCLQLITSRTLNDYRLPEGWLPAAAANPVAANPAAAEYEVDELDPALVSRFVQVLLIPDSKEWLSWARCNDIHPAVIEYVRNDSSVFNHPESNPRAWQYVSDVVRAAQKEGEEAGRSLRAAVIGLVGEKRGAAFLKLLKSNERPLEAEAILSSYGQQGSKLREWVKKGQLDLIESTLLAVKKYLQPKNRYAMVKANRKQWRSLARFLYDLPGDFLEDARKFFEDRAYVFPRRPRK